MNIVAVLAKNFGGKLTQEEKNFLEKWLAESEEHRLLYDRVMKMPRVEVSDIRDSDKRKVWASIIEEVEKSSKPDQKGVPSITPLLKYAAIILIMLTASVYLWYNNHSNSISVKNDAEITLELEQLAKSLESAIFDATRALQFDDINGQNIDYTIEVLNFMGEQLSSVDNKSSDNIEHVLRDKLEIIKQRSQQKHNPVSQKTIESGDIDLF